VVVEPVVVEEDVMVLVEEWLVIYWIGIVLYHWHCQSLKLRPWRRWLGVGLLPVYWAL
jgi:hypothetical protein